MPRISLTHKTPFNPFIFILDNRPGFFFYSKNILYFCHLICSQTIGWIELYQRWTFGMQSDFASWYINSRLVILMLLCDRIVLAFVLVVWRIKARQFIGHRLVFILVDVWLESRSTTSTPALVWSYNRCTWGFRLSSFDTLILSCIDVKTTIFFLPLFFLSMYDTNIRSSSSPQTKKIDFLLRLSTFCIYGGIPFRSSRVVPTTVMFFCAVHCAKWMEVKYLSIEMLQPDIWETAEKPFTRCFLYFLKLCFIQNVGLTSIGQRVRCVRHNCITKWAVEKAILRGFIGLFKSYFLKVRV